MWFFNKEERRARKIRRLEDLLADKESNLSRWGFAYNPSKVRREEEEIDLLKTKLHRLRNKNG